MSLLCEIFGPSGMGSARTSLPIEIVYLLRVMLGGAFGLILGIERSRRQKEAGLATHFVVCLAATLMTCLSLWFKEVADLGDGARIAAQVVTGIGFLGAGMIFFRRESLRGLTTAAGIWATAAIGMCTAVGMYWVALGSTALIIVIQILVHSKLLRRHRMHLLQVKMVYTDEIKDKLMEFFGFETFHRFKVTSANEKFTRDGEAENNEQTATQSEREYNVSSGKKMIAETVIYTTQNYRADEIASFLCNNPEILSIERLEDL